MKANEAPERIWIDPATDLPKLSGHIDKDSVEYIRKDAFLDTLEVKEVQEEPVSCLDNGDMPIERWKQAVEAASNQKNYRRSKGLTETRDDYFVDGVQWADEHPKENPVSEELKEVAKKYGTKKHPMTTIGANESAYDFKAGADWHKEQMMAKAVDAHVNYAWSGLSFSGFNWSKTGLDIGDRCKLIIIKED